MLRAGAETCVGHSRKNKTREALELWTPEKGREMRETVV